LMYVRQVIRLRRCYAGGRGYCQGCLFHCQICSIDLTECIR
jgi:hypothetical protein